MQWIASAARREYNKRNIRKNFIEALQQNDEVSIGEYLEKSGEFGDDFTQELVQLINVHQTAQAEAEEKAEEKRREGEREKEMELIKELEEHRKDTDNLIKKDMKEYIEKGKIFSEWVKNSEWSRDTAGNKDEKGVSIRAKGSEWEKMWEELGGKIEPEESRREVAPSITLYKKPYNSSSAPQKFEVKDFDPEYFMFGGGNKKRNKSKKKSKRGSKRYSKRKYKRHRSKKKKYTKKKR